MGRTSDPGIERTAEASPALLWLVGPDCSCSWVNATWLELTGQDAAEAAGAGWLDAVHPEDLGAFLAANDPVPGPGPASRETEVRLLRADGEWRWILARVTQVTDPDGTAFGATGAGFDVTERHHAGQQLLRSREDLRLALAAGHMGTWVWERSTGRVSRDPNLQALYGLPPQSGDGTFDEWVRMVHPEDRHKVLEEVERALVVGGTYELQHRIVRPDGGVRWLERRGEAYLDEHGAVAGTRGLVIDITERMRGEAERSRLLAAEQQARREAEVAARRVTHLQAITAGLAEARTTDQVAEIIVQQSALGLEASSGALCLLVDDGEHLEVIRHVGYDPTSMERYQRFSIEDDLPASVALRTASVVLLRSLEERDEQFPVLRGAPARNAANAVVPLFADGRPSGAVALGWTEPRDFDDDDRAFLAALGHQAAQALDRAAFHEAEQWRVQRQAFLAEASRLLGSTLDFERSLAEVASLAVPVAADACAVHLVEDGELRRVALSAIDAGGPRRAPLAERIGARPWCLGQAELLAVAKGNVPLLLRRIDTGWPAQLAVDDDHLAVLAELGLRSALAVPMRSHDQALGVVELAMGPSGRRYRPADVPFVDDLAGRAAAAVANGRAHQARTAVAHTLQKSLLPPDVPLLPGLEVAASYRPVSDEVEVGGDFYDVFAAGGGRWGVVIGDVSGKGVPAASLTALARYTVRTAGRRESVPSTVLEILNSSILDDGEGERFCTVALAFVSYGPGGVRFSLACGGQPLPLLVTESGVVRALGHPGSAIGLFPSPELADTSHALSPGDLLVFYTDGVVEARSPDGRWADGLLESTLARCAGRSAQEAVDAIERALLDFAGGRPRDDTAVLVFRRPPDVFHEHLVPGRRAVPLARQHLRSWLDRRVPEADLVEDVVLVAHELATNAERAATNTVDIHVSLEPDRVIVDVSDDGPGFDRPRLPLALPPPEASAGRGLHIVGRLTSDHLIRTGSCGTFVRCTLDRVRRA